MTTIQVIKFRFSQTQNMAPTRFYNFITSGSKIVVRMDSCEHKNVLNGL